MKSTLTILFAMLFAAGCQKDGGRGLGAKLDAIDSRLASIEAGLKNQPRPGRAAARAPKRTPNPKDVYAVPVGDAPYKGAKDAKITVVKAFEFACPYCQKARPTMDQLLKDYGEEIRVVYKHFVVHPNSATIPAVAACAAGKQGKFPEMESAIWAKGFSRAREGGLGQENIDKLANEIGLDMGKYKSDQKPCQAQVRSDQAQLAKLGTRGTPAFYINGRFLSGAQPIDRFKKVIDEELKKANARIGEDGGTAAKQYYEEWILKKGKKSL